MGGAKNANKKGRALRQGRSRRHGAPLLQRRPHLFRQEGSVTLEAAIAMPIYICVAVAVAFILQCVYVHEQIQHAISQASLEIAGTSYIYGLAGALELQREAEGAANRAKDKAKDTIIKTWGLESWAPGALTDYAAEQLDSAAENLIKGANSAVFSQYAKSVARKYLPGYGDGDSDGGDTGASAKPASLGVAGGLDGLDFAGSAYLADGSEDVVIIVTYKMRAPIFIRALSEYTFVQKACAKAWLYGESGSPEAGGEDADEFDIWALGNFERGKKIREIFHANLPQSFPGISAYEGGTATLIKSLDTTAASYQSAKTISQVIGGYVGDLAGYEGQEKPWGSDGIVIRREDIKARRLVLVIPKNDIAPEISAAIDACVQEALTSGVYLQVERYGTKKTEGAIDGAAGDADGAAGDADGAAGDADGNAGDADGNATGGAVGGAG